jgi:cbb3-type cytochrome oxidase cytochrome c subunit
VDGQLGEPLEASRYNGASPSMLGLERIGPDLTHLRSRFTSDEDLIAFLRDPASKGHRTSMPSYGYLGADDLRALAAYLLSRQ